MQRVPPATFQQHFGFHPRAIFVINFFHGDVFWGPTVSPAAPDVVEGAGLELSAEDAIAATMAALPPPLEPATRPELAVAALNVILETVEETAREAWVRRVLPSLIVAAGQHPALCRHADRAVAGGSPVQEAPGEGRAEADSTAAEEDEGDVRVGGGREGGGRGRRGLAPAAAGSQ